MVCCWVGAPGSGCWSQTWRRREGEQRVKTHREENDMHVDLIWVNGEGETVTRGLRNRVTWKKNTQSAGF